VGEWLRSHVDLCIEQLAVCCGPLLTTIHTGLFRLFPYFLILGPIGMLLILVVQRRIGRTYGFAVWFRYPYPHIMRDMSSTSDRRMYRIGNLLMLIFAFYIFVLALSGLVSRVQLQGGA
jgi:hypothetical protein